MSIPAVCEWCGQSLDGHRTMISFAEIGTAKDCAFQLDMRSIEQGILTDVMVAVGLDPKSVSGDITRKAALLLRSWRRG